MMLIIAFSEKVSGGAEVVAFVQEVAFVATIVSVHEIVAYKKRSGLCIAEGSVPCKPK